MKIIVSGGGTGGHIYPAIAVARALENQLKKQGELCEMLYVGTKEGLEAKIIPREGFDFETIQVSGIKRSLSLANIKTVVKVCIGFAQAIVLLRKFRPDVVVGTGGFVCGPMLLAAAVFKIPTVIQEQNALPGITNKLLSRFVTKICLGYREAAPHFPAVSKRKLVYTGNPVRANIVMADKSAAYSELGLNEQRKTVLVVGGSRGARSLNSVIASLYTFFAARSDLQLLHVTGDADFQRALKEYNNVQVSSKNNILIRPYIFNMRAALAVADLAVFRAGAVGLAELTVVGVPAILVPYPFAAENHQEYNARALEKQGAAIVILEKDLSAEIMSEKINRLINETELLDTMAQNSRKAGVTDAAQQIAAIVTECAR